MEYIPFGKFFSTRISEQSWRPLQRGLPTPWWHTDEEGHLPDLKQAKVIHEGLHKHKRKILEATKENVNTASGRFKLFKVATASIVLISSHGQQTSGEYLVSVRLIYLICIYNKHAFPIHNYRNGI